MYAFDGRAAAPDAKVGADVLPWWPATGVYLLIEHGTASAAPLVDVDGVAGAWWAPTAADVPEQYSLAQPAISSPTCSSTTTPVAVAGRLRPVLEQRWADSGVTGLFAAPFHVAHADDLARHLP